MANNPPMANISQRTMNEKVTELEALMRAKPDYPGAALLKEYPQRIRDEFAERGDLRVSTWRYLHNSIIAFEAWEPGQTDSASQGAAYLALLKERPFLQPGITHTHMDGGEVDTDEITPRNLRKVYDKDRFPRPKAADEDRFE